MSFTFSRGALWRYGPWPSLSSLHNLCTHTQCSLRTLHYGEQIIKNNPILLRRCIKENRWSKIMPQHDILNYHSCFLIIILSMRDEDDLQTDSYWMWADRALKDVCILGTIIALHCVDRQNKLTLDQSLFDISMYSIINIFCVSSFMGTKWCWPLLATLAALYLHI